LLEIRARHASVAWASYEALVKKTPHVPHRITAESLKTGNEPPIAFVVARVFPEDYPAIAIGHNGGLPRGAGA
jgi:hypothetical protein